MLRAKPQRIVYNLRLNFEQHSCEQRDFEQFMPLSETEIGFDLVSTR